VEEKTDENFDINDSDIAEHAHIVYNAIQEYYVRIGRMANLLSDNPEDVQNITSSINFFGILPNKRIHYENIFLKNDEFKVSVIYHLCFSNSAGRLLSWEGYLYTYTFFKRLFFETSKDNISVDSIMLKRFNVNPKAIPKSYLTRNMKIDEFNKAVEFIVQRLQKLKKYDDDFEDYDDYFDYMHEHAESIISDCHDLDFFNTHELERFTCACIGQKMNLPVLDTLYNIEEMGTTFKLDLDNVKDVQEQILDKLFDNDN